MKHNSTDGVGAAGEPQLRWCKHCGEGVTDFCRGKLRLCPKGLPVLHRNAAAADDWQRPDNTCPRCKQPAFNLFRTRLPGDELDTTHCGCLYAPGVTVAPHQTFSHQTPMPSDKDEPR